MEDDTKAQDFHGIAPIRCWQSESCDELSAIFLDNALRREVVRVRGDVDVRQTNCISLAQNNRQGLRRIPEAAPPGNDRESDMPETMLRQLRFARVPAQFDSAGEVPVPHPADESRKARHVGFTWTGAPRAIFFHVGQTSQIRIRRTIDLRQDLNRCVRASHVIGAVASLQCGSVCAQAVNSRHYQMHSVSCRRHLEH